MDRVALPICQITLKTNKPMKIVRNPNTIGEHLKRRRQELNLLQSDVAKILKVNRNTINYWETNRNKPTNKNIPKIINFLKHIPNDFQSSDLGSKLIWYRKSKGLSQKEFAEMLKIDKTTLSRWEQNKTNIRKIKHSKIIEKFLEIKK